jgi:hypothetical protein
MEVSPRGGFRWQRLDFLLLAIVLLSAIPRLYLGATQFVEYDGYWHVFVAQQDRWANFVWDWRQVVHPPLYFFLLRETLWIGKSDLAYRAISLLAGLVSIVVLGRIASKMMRSAMTPALAALAYGLAMPAIITSCEVRAYMLCTLFLLISYTFFLDMIGREEPGGSVKGRIMFVVSAMLACATEYYAAFFVVAVFALSVLVPVLRRSVPLWKAWAWEAATYVPVFGVMVYLYAYHVSTHAVLQQHLLPFYYRSTGPEPLGEFLLRNLQSTFDMFSPWPAPGRTVFLIIAAALVAAVCGTLWLLRRLWEPRNLAAAATVVVTTLILLEIIVASLKRVYPFGGFLRQQSLLIPFLFLCALIIPDRLTAALARRAGYALAAVFAAAILWVSYREFDAFPKVQEALMTDNMQRYNHLVPEPAAVYVDQYNLITFFFHHDDWEWKFVETSSSRAGIDIYRLSRGARHMLLFRDKDRWLIDPLDAGLYEDLAAFMRTKALPSITLFRVAQEQGAREAAELRADRKQIGELATASGLCVDKLDLHDYDVYMEVRPGVCDAAAAKGKAANDLQRRPQ